MPLALLAPACADDNQIPCHDRMPTLAEFPPRVAQTAVLTPATLQQMAGGKGWGFTENLAIEMAPDGVNFAVTLPKGSIDPKHPTAPLGGVGFRWRAEIPPTALRACLSYRLLLPANFQFNKGGKLPGLFGGDGPAGGKAVDGLTGFSARLMWRQAGAGEVYAYIPGKPEGRGLSIGRGAWTFPRGRWFEIQQEIVLNSPGQANGVIRIWLDRQSVLARDDVLIRHADTVSLAGVMADIFYGGKSEEWAAPADTIIRFSSFQLGWK